MIGDSFEVSVKRLFNAAPEQFLDFVYQLSSYSEKLTEELIKADQTMILAAQGRAQVLRTLVEQFTKVLPPQGG